MRIKADAWDVVVLDLTLPGASGLDLLKEIRRERPGLPVLVLSMHPASQFARRVLSAGASGYLTKDSAATDLVHAVEQIRRGKMYLGTSMPEWTRTPPAGKAPHDSLSDREYQVLRMIGSGLTVSEIAATCGLSVKTVSTYRRAVTGETPDAQQRRSDAVCDRERLDGFVAAPRLARDPGLELLFFLQPGGDRLGFAARR